MKQNNTEYSDEGCRCYVFVVHGYYPCLGRYFIPILEFVPGAKDGWADWPARIAFSISDDGLRLTLIATNGNSATYDMRTSRTAICQSVASSLIEGGLETPPILLSDVWTAVYQRE